MYVPFCNMLSHVAEYPCSPYITRIYVNVQATYYAYFVAGHPKIPCTKNSTATTRARHDVQPGKTGAAITKIGKYKLQARPNLGNQKQQHSNLRRSTLSDKIFNTPASI